MITLAVLIVGAAVYALVFWLAGGWWSLIVVLVGIGWFAFELKSAGRDEEK